ncbi:amidohydrolase family protein [Salinispira pacifica]
MIPINEFRPVSRLETPVTEIRRPRFPVIDAHSHLKRPNDPAELVERMDQFGIRLIVDLDGFWDGSLEEELRRYPERYPDRFRVFCRVNVEPIDDEGFGKRAREYVLACHRKGAAGIKFSKSLGLKIRDRYGNFIRPDDDRLRPIWEAAAEVGIPVTIHIADPPAFFDPIDPTNERYEELAEHPHWSYHTRGCPGFHELLECQHRLLERNPDTTFIVAHVGSYAENLRAVGAMLDRYPNMYVDTAERISELGRQPYSAREFIIKYQDRVIYGTDLLPNATNTGANYRFFESWDEYFPYNSFEEHNQGRWNIYGIGLPDEVLRKVYVENAERLILKERS